MYISQPLALQAPFSSASMINWFTTKCTRKHSEAMVTKEIIVSGIIITEAKLRVV